MSSLNINKNSSSQASVVDNSLSDMALEFKEESTKRTWEGSVKYLIRAHLENDKYSEPIIYTFSFYAEQKKSSGKWQEIKYRFSIPELGYDTGLLVKGKSRTITLTSYYDGTFFNYGTISLNMSNLDLSDEDFNNLEVKFKLNLITDSGKEEISFWKSKNTYFRLSSKYFGKSLESEIMYNGKELKLVELSKGEYELEPITSNLEKLLLEPYSFTIDNDGNAYHENNPIETITFKAKYIVEEKPKEKKIVPKKEKPVEDIAEEEPIEEIIEEPIIEEDPIIEVPENYDDITEIVIEDENQNSYGKVKAFILSKKALTIVLPIVLLLILIIFYIKHEDVTK